MKNFRGQSFKQSINIETVFQCKVLVKYVAQNLCLKQSDWRLETNQNAGNWHENFPETIIANKAGWFNMSEWNNT